MGKRLLAEYEREMAVLAANEPGDRELNHLEADKILLRLLRDLGHNNICDLFEQVEKWYA